MLKKIVPVLAAALLLAGSVSGSDTAIVPDKTCSLTIKYYESTDKADPVSGAVFTCYRVADQFQVYKGNTVRNVWRSVVKREGGQGAELPEDVAVSDVEAAALEAYRDGVPEGGFTASAVTGEDGTAVMSGLIEGLYLIVETKSVKGYQKTAPFLAELPKTETGDGGAKLVYDVTAEPKPQPCGDLKITKTVPGRKDGGGEEFGFTLTLETEGTYVYEKSDKTRGTVKNGSGVGLRSGESVYISGLPAGTVYRVIENEADSNGYKTFGANTEGRIVRGKCVTAAFTNTPTANGPSPTPTLKVTPTPVTKVTPTPTVTPKATPTPTETPSNKSSSKSSDAKTGSQTGGTSAVQKSTAVKTGDEGGLTEWILIFIFSGAVLTLMKRKAGI